MFTFIGEILLTLPSASFVLKKLTLVTVAGVLILSVLVVVFPKVGFCKVCP
jgi:hypothetical protein